MDDTSTISPGSCIAGRFEIRDLLGRGGMGEVYEAWDKALEQRVALKTIRPDLEYRAEIVDRFKRELLLARRIAHPNICRIFEFGVHTVRDGAEAMEHLFFTMEFVDGMTLEQHRHQSGPFPLSVVWRLAMSIVGGLAAAHELGVVHRDFKSANVMVVGDLGVGQIDRVLITDFGLACDADSRAVNTQLTTPGAMLGTPAYMAPEQIEGKPSTPAVDVYAVGVLLYELVSGHLPFEADSPWILATMRLQQKPPSLGRFAPQLPGPWEVLIMRCLARDAHNRFEDARALERALECLKPNENDGAVTPSNGMEGDLSSTQPPVPPMDSTLADTPGTACGAHSDSDTLPEMSLGGVPMGTVLRRAQTVISHDEGVANGPDGAHGGALASSKPLDVKKDPHQPPLRRGEIHTSFAMASDEIPSGPAGQRQGPLTSVEEHNPALDDNPATDDHAAVDDDPATHDTPSGEVPGTNASPESLVNATMHLPKVNTLKVWAVVFVLISGAMLARASGTMHPLDNWRHDQFRNRMALGSSGQTLIVHLDDVDGDPWPWRRETYVRLLEKLLQDGAKRLMVDVVLGPEQLPENGLEGERAEDFARANRALSHLVRKRPDVSFAFAVGGRLSPPPPTTDLPSTQDPFARLYRFEERQSLAPALETLPKGFAVLLEDTEEEPHQPRAPQVAIPQVADLAVGPSLSLAALACVQADGYRVLGNRRGFVIKSSERALALDGSGWFEIPYVPAEYGRWVHASSVLSGEVDPALIAQGPVVLGRLKGGLGSDREAAVGGEPGRRPGVGSQAAYLDALMHHESRRRISPNREWWLQMGVMALAGLLLASRKRLMGWLVILLGLASLCITIEILLEASDVWLNLPVPELVGIAALVFVLHGVQGRWTSTAQLRPARRAGMAGTPEDRPEGKE